ncbi:MAG TPA: glucosaminidase domain-containing protein [Caulobacteraceae bacterium]|nr:glucosaminidase domain-containing protein [Caulobacteraceae bacterium]
MMQAPADIVAAAQAAQKATAVPASVSLGQWALESAWGQRCTGKFNFFGVKAQPGQPSTLCWTHEEQNGRLVACQAAFRDYDSVADAFLEHAELLCGPRYAAARGALTAGAFVRAIAPAYATDPNYAAKLIGLINIEQFARFDLPQSA